MAQWSFSYPKFSVLELLTALFDVLLMCDQTRLQHKYYEQQICGREGLATFVVRVGYTHIIEIGYMEFSMIKLNR